MINPLFDQNAFKILSLFSLSPGSRFSRKEIKQKTCLNNVPLDSALIKAIKVGIIKREGNYYSVNFLSDESKIIIQLLSRQYKQLKEIPFDVYLMLSDISYRLSFSKEAEAYLFGSYSKLVYREGSDVDIAILTTKKFGKKNFEKEISRIEKLYKKKIETHYFDKQSFYKNKKDPLVKEIIKNGVRII